MSDEEYKAETEKLNLLSDKEKKQDEN